MKFELKKVVVEDVYETIHNFVQTKDMIVDDYEAMINVILAMIKEGYCFTMDRDILRDAMESLTYMYSPSDDMNKDRLIQQFCDEMGSDDEEDDSSGEDDNGFGNMDLMKMMQMMGGMPPPTEGNVEQTSETCEEPVDQACEEDCKKVVTDEEPVEDTTTVVKEDDIETVE